MFGRYIPFANVDVSCLVNIDNGSDLAMCRIADADKIPIEQVRFARVISIPDTYLIPGTLFRGMVPRKDLRQIPTLPKSPT